MTKPPPPSNLAGLLIINKPHRLSSTSIVRVVKHRAKKAKTGHAGTLDPLATGVLILCIGRAATKTVPIIMNMPKRYRATIDLSANSETDDLEGTITPVNITQIPTLQTIRILLDNQFTGEIMQLPPAHSAMRINGKYAYKLARAGQKVTLQPRPIQIYNIKIINYDFPQLTIDIHCGKGTYIRSLARDIGSALNLGGYLTDLCRTAVGSYTIENAIELENVPDPITQNDLLPPPSIP